MQVRGCPVTCLRECKLQWGAGQTAPRLAKHNLRMWCSRWRPGCRHGWLQSSCKPSSLISPPFCRIASFPEGKGVNSTVVCHAHVPYPGGFFSFVVWGWRGCTHMGARGQPSSGASTQDLSLIWNSSSRLGWLGQWAPGIPLQLQLRPSCFHSKHLTDSHLPAHLLNGYGYSSHVHQGSQCVYTVQSSLWPFLENSHHPRRKCIF